jgi:hypothetical protein
VVVTRWQAPPLTPERKHELLQEALAKAWRALFFARKLEAAGFRPGQAAPETEWSNLPLTTKDEVPDPHALPLSLSLNGKMMQVR